MANTDKFPQFYKMRVVGGAVGTYIQKSYETPVQLETAKRIRAMEILKIFLFINMQDSPFSVTNNKRAGITIQLTKSEQSALLQGDHVDLLFRVEENYHRQQTTSGASGISSRMPLIFDLTDGKGNGVVITDKTIHLGQNTDPDNASNNTVSMWLLYKMANVSSEEVLEEAFLQS